jgi:hypothetical protein
MVPPFQWLDVIRLATVRAEEDARLEVLPAPITPRAIDSNIVDDFNDG